MGGQRQWIKNKRRQDFQRDQDHAVTESKKLQEFGQFLDELNKRFREATLVEKAEIRQRLLMDLSQTVDPSVR